MSSNVLKKFQIEYNQINVIALSNNTSFKKDAHLIPRFLQEYCDLCLENMETIDPKVRFSIFSDLHSLCIKILESYPSEIDSHESIKKFFNARSHKESDVVSIDFSKIIRSLQTLKDVKDVTEIGDALCFYYYTILEYYIILSNNLAYTSLEQENYDLAIEFIIRAIQCWELMQYNSYYLKYQISTVLINLVSLIEDDYKLECSQILCNIAMHLEALEVETDQDAENMQIYEHLNERASQFLFLLK